MLAVVEKHYNTVQYSTVGITHIYGLELDESLVLSSKLMVSDEVEKIESISVLVIFVYVHN